MVPRRRADQLRTAASCATEQTSAATSAHRSHHCETVIPEGLGRRFAQRRNETDGKKGEGEDEPETAEIGSATRGKQSVAQGRTEPGRCTASRQRRRERQPEPPAHALVDQRLPAANDGSS